PPMAGRKHRPRRGAAIREGHEVRVRRAGLLDVPRVARQPGRADRIGDGMLREHAGLPGRTDSLTGPAALRTGGPAPAHHTEARERVGTMPSGKPRVLVANRGE